MDIKRAKEIIKNTNHKTKQQIIDAAKVLLKDHDITSWHLANCRSCVATQERVIEEYIKNKGVYSNAK